MHDVFIGLGSNLDDPVARVRAAIGALGSLDATQLVRASSLYRTKPVGYAQQPDFVNAVARLATRLPAHVLLQQLQAIEQAAGRTRSLANGPRTLDLDLLLYDGAHIATPPLAVPHPRMHARAFVLVPLVEIAPGVEIPGRGAAATLLEALGTHEVVRIGDA
ncbi:MAG: 2-amino-4-hydroxy-6-hydroxymethyldihydropteridine diphosphokinase [Burkholderiales bacterium]|nr:2-amino-4-hydroxy-6-hydroxymethyldihydropteridine diphosphokinase [Burkholderiales bacterium]